jgi:regulator of protease activity HflC (stomatin/prohibitin superfamily)
MLRDGQRRSHQAISGRQPDRARLEQKDDQGADCWTFAFVGTREGLHIVVEGDRQVYQVRVCAEEEAQRLAAKANGELGLSEAEIERLIEQSLPK